MEGSDAHPKWYAHVCYVVPATQLPATPEAGAIGVDRNLGQCILVWHGASVPDPSNGPQDRDCCTAGSAASLPSSG